MRCHELGQSTLGKIDCIYNQFSNGERITTAHRQCYRRRDDLMRAFPDPFATHEPDSSYYHWYLADNAHTDEVASPDGGGEVTLLRRTGRPCPIRAAAVGLHGSVPPERRSSRPV